MLVCPVCRLVLSGSRCAAHGADGVDVSPDPLHAAQGSRFRVRRPFAVGDTGTCYEAEEIASKRSGLLKVLRVRENAGRDAAEKLSTEIQNQTSLSATSFFVPIRRVGVDDGVPWLFRDFVPGESLKARLARSGRLSLPDALVITAQVALALHELHSRGLVHRAVRPGHVMLRADATATPHAMLIEAGMAGRNDRSSALEDLGDLFYMAPEIARGDKVSFRADLYSLGCTLYDMLVGEPPFDGEDADAVVYGHLYHPPPIPHGELPGSIATLLEQLLAKAPFDRPLSAQQVLREIDPFLPEDWQDPPHSAVPPSAPDRRVRVTSAPPPSIPLARVAAPPPPPAAVPLTQLRPVAPAPPPLPSVQVKSAAPPVPVAAPEYVSAAPSFVPPPEPTPKLRSISSSDIDAYDTSRARRSRFPRAAAGFVLGCATTVAAMWALAYSGNFHLVTDAMTTHLAVPASRIAPEARVVATAEPAPAPVPAAAPAPVAAPSAVQAPSEPPATEVAPEAEPAAPTEPEPSVEPEREPEPRMTRAERRRALRQARIERRRARIRARRIARAREARAEARRAESGDLLF